jgi:hypothetical protein
MVAVDFCEISVHTSTFVPDHMSSSQTIIIFMQSKTTDEVNRTDIKRGQFG